MDTAKKVALVTGGTKGIGKAVADMLELEGFKVITVARSHAVENGDLLDKEFRDYLVKKYQPNIFVNNAALVTNNLLKMLEVNGTAAVDLLLQFYEKMSDGIIINISSISAEKGYHTKESVQRIIYSGSKKLLKDISLSLSYSKNKPIKVMCLSPAATDTDMIKILAKGFKPPSEHYSDYNWETSICWTRPFEVAEVVKWLIHLPPWISVSELNLDNHYSYAINW